METDIAKTKKIAEKKEDENWAFRSFLKWYDGRDVDTIVHRLNHKYADAIDCTTCGNCCRELQIVLKRTDITILSTSLGISLEQFKKDYVRRDDGAEVFNQLPCPILKDNKCRQYDSRPAECKSFPHLHKEDFTFRLLGVMHNYSICPIVFNVYEELKDILKDDFTAFQETTGDSF